MFAIRELARLNSRKTALLARSEAIRQQLRQNWATLEPVVLWVEVGTTWMRRIRPAYLLGAALFGLWAARREHSVSGWQRRLKTLWTVGRHVTVAWNCFLKGKA